MMTNNYSSSLSTEVLSEILLTQEVIENRVRALGLQITRELGHQSLCICPLLDGGMIFAADLIRTIDLPVTLLPLKASSYGAGTESSGTVQLPWGVPETVHGKHLLIVDDILDTGRTLAVLKGSLVEAGALTIHTCVLLRKEYSRELRADYIGFDIPNQFVVGYGLDLAGLYRNLPCIGIPKEALIEAQS